MGCLSCSKQLSRRTLQKIAAGKSTSGLCMECWQDKVRKNRFCTDCGAKVSKRSAQRCISCSNRERAKDETYEARRFALMREALKRPEVRARRIRANIRVAERKMRWCPEKYRQDYFRLLKKYGKRAGAKAEILSMMTPFERQMSRVLEGAPVVEKVQLREREYDFTLGGVSEALC